MTRSELEHAIDEHILNDRDRYILKRKLADGWSYPEILESMDIDKSLSWIQHRGAEAQKQLNRYL